MKTHLKFVCALTLMSVALAASEAALAQHHRGHARFGVYVGAPYYYSPFYYPRPYYSSPYYYPPSYYPPSYYPPYYAPVVATPAAAPVYVEQGSSAVAPAPAPQASSQQNWWYYCTESRAYYPYVKDCPAGWQRIAPQPPNG